MRARLWASDTFVDFEQGFNAAIRRLREALGDSADAPRFVQTLPRRGYRFIAAVERPNANSADQPQPLPADSGTSSELAARTGTPQGIGGSASRWWRSAIVVAVATLSVALVAVWRQQKSASTGAPPLQVVPLTTLIGAEHGPTFSPEGSEVAFAWDGEQQENIDIYVKRIGSPEIRRLTTDPEVDLAPQWSPDGTRIAFLRRETRTSYRIRLVSSVGGSDHALNGFPVRTPAIWSPDGRYLVAARAREPGDADRSTGIYAIPIDKGAASHPGDCSPRIRRMAVVVP